MGDVIQLCTSESCVHLDLSDKKWCRCSIVWNNTEYYLGADSPDKITGRLLNALSTPWDDLTDLDAGAPYGYIVRWVLSLAEEHSALYMAVTNECKLLFWQLDKNPAPIIMHLLPEQASKWREQLLKHVEG